MGEQQVKVLIEQMVELGWTMERAVGAVNHVIRTCEFNAPTLARFLQFDKKRRLYTYDEMTAEVFADPGLTTDNFKTGVIEGTRYWWKS